jgi:hypothetical protein
VIDDKTAIVMADELYRATCARLKKRPFETAGEIAFANGLKIVVLFDDSARLSSAYRVTEDGVVDLDGPTMTAFRARLQHRKVRG